MDIAPEEGGKLASLHAWCYTLDGRSVKYGRHNNPYNAAINATHYKIKHIFKSLKVMGFVYENFLHFLLHIEVGMHQAWNIL